MIKIHESSATLHVEVSDLYGRSRRVNLSDFLILGHDWRFLIDPVVRSLHRVNPVSQVNILRGLATIGHALGVRGYKNLPGDSEGWQSLILFLYEFALSRPDRRQKLAARVRGWNRVVAPMLIRLRDVDDVIPANIEIPKAPERLEDLDTTSYQDQFIGDIPAQSVNQVTTHDKLLVSISLARTDAEYLDEVRDELNRRRAILETCFLGWWAEIKAHYEYGRAARSLIDANSLRQEMRVIEARPKNSRARHPATGRTKYSLGLLLAIIEAEHDGMFTKSTRVASSFLPELTSIRLPDSAPKPISRYVFKTQQINWMLGSLSRFDIAMCMGLLIMHNAKFTPFSLARALIVDKDGRPHLELSDLGVLFRIEKARAAAMKPSILDDASLDVVTTIIRMTQNLRERLAEKRSPLANLLFVNADRGRICVVNEDLVGVQLSGARSGSTAETPILFRHFPQLVEEGFQKGSVTFSKIRATEGVLEWFRTGSVSAMSKKLGNKLKTVLQHYLPDQLLAIWNTRQVRRFQNLWLAVASAKETFLLEATDFQSLADLHIFLVDMLKCHELNSSPFAKLLHNAFDGLIEINGEASSPNKSGSLAVSISTQTLVALYSYRDAALRAGVSPVVLDARDALTGCSPRQFLTLSELLAHQLPKERDGEMRRAHVEAVQLVDSLDLASKWSALFVSKRAYGHADS